MVDRRSLVFGFPLLLTAGCIPGRNQASIMTNPVFAAIENRIGGRLGVALVDHHGSLISSHRGNERFALCSTFKAPLASALMTADANGLLDMDRKFLLKSGDSVPYMPFVKKYLESGAEVSLRELAKAALQTSDNAAANLVLRAIGGPRGFTDFVRNHGDNVTRLDRWETELNENLPGDPRDTTNPIAMAWLMHKLLLDSQTNSTNRTMLQDWMKGSVTGRDRIRAGVPDGWTVGNKTGTAPGGTAYNDIAIIWPSLPGNRDTPFILTVYTDRPTVASRKVNTAIADVAKAAAGLIVQSGS